MNERERSPSTGGPGDIVKQEDGKHTSRLFPYEAFETPETLQETVEQELELGKINEVLTSEAASDAVIQEDGNYTSGLLPYETFASREVLEERVNDQTALK